MKVVVYLDKPEFQFDVKTLTEVHDQVIKVDETEGFVLIVKKKEIINYRKDLVLKVHSSDE